MFDLHSHILPGIDDGAADEATALAMARAYVDQGVTDVACTPHILPGVYHNSGPQIRAAVQSLQTQLLDSGIGLRLHPGADNHIVPDFVAGLARGHLLAIADSKYVLVEPPHHVAPARLEDLFFGILVAGYIPVLTHPERLTWIESKYDLICRLFDKGVLMQVTSGALRGSFGSRPRYWADRMVSEGRVHILASDAHNVERRPPDLAEGLRCAERLVGAEEAHHLVATRPRSILSNVAISDLPAPVGAGRKGECVRRDESHEGSARHFGDGLAGRLRRLFAQ